MQVFGISFRAPIIEMSEKGQVIRTLGTRHRTYLKRHPPCGCRRFQNSQIELTPGYVAADTLTSSLP